MRLISYLTFCSFIFLSLAGAAYPQAAKSELIGEEAPNARFVYEEITSGKADLILTITYSDIFDRAITRTEKFRMLTDGSGLRNMLEERTSKPK